MFWWRPILLRITWIERHCLDDVWHQLNQHTPLNELIDVQVERYLSTTHSCWQQFINFVKSIEIKLFCLFLVDVYLNMRMRKLNFRKAVVFEFRTFDHMRMRTKLDYLNRKKFLSKFIDKRTALWEPMVDSHWQQNFSYSHFKSTTIWFCLDTHTFENKIIHRL